MSTNQTQHLHLSQWEENDEILRADFNSDNSKIDAALAAVKATADAISAAAYTSENKPYVSGTYTGDGAASQFIALGFTPSAVLVASHNGCMSFYYSGFHGEGGLAVTGYNISDSNTEGITEWKDGKTYLAIEEGGFRVGHVSRDVSLNSGVRVYIAFR